MGLSGTIDKTYVVASWKGFTYVRRYEVPRNPRSKKQQRHRARFAEAVAAWRRLTAKERKTYDRRAVGMSGYNLFISEFMAPGK